MANLKDLPRSKLQKLAKKNGIKANQKTTKLVELLLKVLSPEDIENFQLKDLNNTTNASLDITNLTQNTTNLTFDTTNVTFDAEKVEDKNETKENETEQNNTNENFDDIVKVNETEGAEKSFSDEKSCLNETFDVSISNKILNSSSTPKKVAISEFLTDDEQTVNITTSGNNSKNKLTDMSFGNVSVLSNLMTDDEDNEDTSLLVNNTNREQNDRLKEVTLSKVIEPNMVEDANTIDHHNSPTNTCQIINKCDSEIDEKIKLKKFETEINSYKVDKVCEKDINHENIVKNEECVEKASPVKINSDKMVEKNIPKKRRPLISAPRQPANIANTVTFENWSNSKEVKKKKFVKVPKDEVRRSPRINSMNNTPNYKVGTCVNLKRKRSKTPAKIQQTISKSSPVKKITKPVTDVSNKKKTKVIDFQKLYERKMAKVESIDDHEKRKQARMKKIMSATKPEKPKTDNSNAKRTQLNFYQSKLKTPKPAALHRKRAKVESSLHESNTSSLNSKIFKPTEITTKNMKIDFAKKSGLYQFKSGKQTSRKLETPKKEFVQKRTKEDKPGSLLKNKQVSRLSSTPFKLGNGSYVESPKIKFNLKDSLKKKLTYKPHTGPLKQYEDTTVKPMRRLGAKERSIASSNMKKLQKREVQKSKRNNVLMKRRGLK